MMSTKQRLETLEQTQAQMMKMMEQMMKMMNSPKQAKAQNAPKQEKEVIEYKKADGTVVKCTPAQAKAWDAWKSNSKKSEYGSKEEFTQAMAKLTSEFKFTKDADEYIKAHPTCTQKEFSQAGFKGCTKAMLKEHKAELRKAGIIR